VTDRCEIPGCRAEAALDYLGHGVCDPHWNQFTADDVPRDALRMALGLAVETPPAMGETTMEHQIDNDNTTATNEAEVPAEEHAVTAKTKTAKARKAATPKIKATKVKATKEPKAKKAKPPKEPQPGRVFAFRLTDEELAAIHKAAGPRNATRSIRAVAAAFAAEDEAGFRAVVHEARKVRL
jgi:uncharacterized protein (DUF4415 family)